jgi:glutathione S-transferase
MADLTLVIGNRNYSSWSMRAGVLMPAKGIEFEEVQIPLRQPGSVEEKLRYSPAGKVPVLIDRGLHIWESLSIMEHLAELFPDRGLWPEEARARAVARSVSAEMHAGFEALRTHMPMNCRARYPGQGRGPGVQEDIERIVALWNDCRARFGQQGDFLFGEFTIADAMFTPVVARFQTYDVELDPVARAYTGAVLAHPAVAGWMAAGESEPWTISEYDLA